MRGRALTSVSRVGSILWQLVRSAAAQALRDGRIKIVAPRSECAVEVKNHSIVQPCERGAHGGGGTANGSYICTWYIAEVPCRVFL
jgi:hypothetical protein